MDANAHGFPLILRIYTDYFKFLSSLIRANQFNSWKSVGIVTKKPVRNYL